MIQTEELVVKLKFISDILGTAPSQELLKRDFFKLKETMALMEAEKRKVETGNLSVEAFTEEEYEVAMEGSEEIPRMTHFRKDGFIYIPNFMIKGYFKSAAQALKDQIGLRAFKSKIDRYLFVFPNKIRFYRGGEPIKEPDDVFVRPLRASTPKGERVSLVASERIAADEKNPVETDKVSILLIRNKEIDLDMVEELLNYGYYYGVSQFRNGGFGRFTYEVVSRTRAEDGVKRKKVKVKVK